MSEQRAHASVLAIGLAAFMVLGMLGIASVPARAAITPEWVVETPLPEARVFAVVVADAEGLVYVCGGSLTGIYEAPLDSAFTYDSVTGAVNWLPSMPVGVRGGTGAVGDDGRVYVFTGFNDTIASEVPYTQIYDPVTMSWSTGADIPISMWASKAALGSDGLLYVFGGSDSSGVPLNAVQVYDPVFDMWFAGAAMPDGLYHGAAIAWREYIFYLGGLDDTYGTSESVYYYYVPGDYWNYYGEMPLSSWGGAGCLGEDGNLYYFGGNSGTAIGDGVCLDLNTGEWQDLPVMNQATLYFGAVSVPDGRILAIGGSDWTYTYDRVESLNVADVSITLSSDTVKQGGSVLLMLEADYAFVAPDGQYVEYYIMGPDGMMYDYDWIDTGVWAGLVLELSIPDVSPPGVYTVVIEAYYFYENWNGWYIAEGLELTLTVVEAYTLEEQLAMLEENVTALGADLQAQLDALAVAVADGDAALATDIATLQTAVDALSADLVAVQESLDDLTAAVDEGDTALAADIAALQTQLTALQTSLTSLQASIDEANQGVTDVQGSVDDKMSLVMGYAILGLLVVVIVLLAMMMVMGRKAVPPPPSS